MFFLRFVIFEFNLSTEIPNGRIFKMKIYYIDAIVIPLSAATSNDEKRPRGKKDTH